MYEIDENGELVFKRKVVMTMTEERAALLDKILLAATESNQTVILHATSPNDKTEYIPASKLIQFAIFLFLFLRRCSLYS